MSAVLFVCTGNSARSIMAEAIANAGAGGRWIAYSAGSRPRGAVHPLALKTLAAHGVPAPDARSKSWDAFVGPDAPPIDLVVTVCDSAAGEACPLFPAGAAGSQTPERRHWPFPDPAAAPEDEAEAAFEAAFHAIAARVTDFLAEDGAQG